MGVTARNIMATVITTHVTRKRPAPTIAIPPMPAGTAEKRRDDCRRHRAWQSGRHPA